MDPKAMATSLHTKGFITDSILEEINTLPQTNTDKARCLYSTILKVVKEYPQRYSDFIQILQMHKLLHGGLLKVLQETYQKNSTLFRYCMFVSSTGDAKYRALKNTQPVCLHCSVINYCICMYRLNTSRCSVATVSYFHTGVRTWHWRYL